MNDINAEYTQVLQVQSDNYQPRETYVYGVQRISNEQNNNKTFYQYDAKGSVIGQESNKKEDALFFKVRYNDFGQPHRKLDNEFGYNAEAHDYNGTQYLRARYYDTKNGRFDQRDSYMGQHGTPLSENRYTYVWNNPNKYTDPSGHRLEIEGADPGMVEAINKADCQYDRYLRGEITRQEFIDLVGALWTKYNLDFPEHAVDVGQTKDSAGKLADSEYAKNQAEAAKAAKAAAQQAVIDDLMNELINQRNLNLPDLSGLSREEQIRILREIKKICDEIEGKYGRWDEAARDEAQKKVEVMFPNHRLSILEILSACVDWTAAFLEVVSAFNSGLKINGIGTLLKHIKLGTVGSIKITVSGAREAVKELAGLSTGPKTYLSTALKNSIGHQVKQVFSKLSVLAMVFEIAIDTAFSIVDLVLGLITMTKFIAEVITSILYTVLKVVAATLVRAILTPFIGPFAWILGFLIEVGFDLLDMFFNVKEVIANFIDYVIVQSWDFVSSLMNSLADAL